MSRPVFADWNSITIRRNRKSYFLACLALFPVFFGLNFLVLGTAIFESRIAAPVVFQLVMLAVLAVPMAAWLNLSAQRLRDVGLSGWWFVVFLPGFISDFLVAAFPRPVVILLADVFSIGGFIMFIALLLAPGNKGKNRFGADPRKAGAR